nr:MAG TPA: hypothetical protein [Caudoviricetes sp.]
MPRCLLLGSQNLFEILKKCYITNKKRGNT